MTKPATPPEEELREIATGLKELLSGDALFNYVVALEGLLDIKLPEPRIRTHDMRSLSLDQAPADVQAHIRKRFMTPGGENTVVSSIIELIGEAAGCAQGFLDNRPGYGMMDTARQFQRLEIALCDCLGDKVPQYGKRADIRLDEQIAAATAANGGKKPSLDEITKMVQNDPLELFSKVTGKLAFFTLVAAQAQERSK